MIKESLKYFKFFEGKQVGIIYHFTSVVEALSIFKEDVLISGYSEYMFGKEEHFISFTRSKFLSPNTPNNIIRKGDIWGTIRIAVDGDKLSNKYKIVPYNYFSGDKDYKKSKQNEFEERVLTEKIPNFSKYVKYISILDVNDFQINMLFKLKDLNKSLYDEIIVKPGETMKKLFSFKDAIDTFINLTGFNKIKIEK